MTPLPTTIFEFHKVISALTIPTPTLSLVKANVYAWKQPNHLRSDIHGHLSLPHFFFSPADVYHLFDLKRSWSGALYFTRRHLFQRQLHSTHLGGVGWEPHDGALESKWDIRIPTSGRPLLVRWWTDVRVSDLLLGVSLIWFSTSGTKTTRKVLADFLKPLLLI